MNEQCKQPAWEGIIDSCKRKIENKFPEYGNSWINAFWLDERLHEEYTEFLKIKDGFDWEKKISELEDVINICAMMITNFHNYRNREMVGERLGI